MNLTRELLLVGDEQRPALADSHLVQSLGAEWTREPNRVPGWGSSNTGLVQICVAVRGELCYPFVCAWAGVLLAWTSLAINVSLRKRTLSFIVRMDLQESSLCCTEDLGAWISLMEILNDKNKKCIRPSTGLAAVTHTCFIIHINPGRERIWHRNPFICYLPSNEVGVISFYKLRPFRSRTDMLAGEKEG